MLSGTGVSQATTVSGRGTTTWQVVFTAGKYTYVCDPHPSMNGALTVT